MGEFLLLLFIIFIVIPILRGVWAVYKLRRKAKNAFRQFEEQVRQQQEAYNRSNRQEYSEDVPKTKKKKIDSSQGEYVEWEEVKVSEHTLETCSNAQSEVKIEKEQQITDAEWEEIK